MTFHRLTLTNFGIYKGIQTFDLSPEKNKPIILIGGWNGRGKTTFLEAIQIALYGKLAPFLARKKVSYSDYIMNHHHKGMDERDVTSIELIFSLVGRESYRAVRAWSGVSENFSIYQGDQEELLLTHSWYDFLEIQFPLRIAPLFLFDGEQVESLANPEKTAVIIKSAIHSLLGISIIEKLEHGLKVFEKRYIPKLEPLGQEELKKIWERSTELEKQIKEKISDIGNRNNSLDRLKKKKKEQEYLFRENGGDLFLQRETIKNEIETWQERSLSIHEKILEAVSGAAPLLLVKELLRKVEHQICNETDLIKNRNVLDILQDRDEKILEELNKLNSGKEFKTIATYLSNDRKKRETETKGEVFLELPNNIFLKTNGLRTRIKSMKKDYRDLIEINDLHKKKDIDLKLRETAIPLEADILPLFEELQEVEKAFAELSTDIRNCEIERKKLRTEEEANRKRIARLLENRIKNKLTAEDNNRIMHFAKKGRETLSLFRWKMIQKHLPGIAEEINKSLKKILNKSNLYHSIAIDTNFSISMTNSVGQEISPRNLSAGERQLLAISILHGLAAYSGKDLPTIIDTPLGRLDSYHREKLVTDYFPEAGRQVILLSTDSEIDYSFFEKLEPLLSRSYLLHYHEEGMYTEVKAGYFHV